MKQNKNDQGWNGNAYLTDLNKPYQALLATTVITRRVDISAYIMVHNKYVRILRRAQTGSFEKNGLIVF